MLPDGVFWHYSSLLSVVFWLNKSWLKRKYLQLTTVRGFHEHITRAYCFSLSPWTNGYILGIMGVNKLKLWVHLCFLSGNPETSAERNAAQSLPSAWTPCWKSPCVIAIRMMFSLPRAALRSMAETDSESILGHAPKILIMWHFCK